MPIFTRTRAIAMPQKPGISGLLENVEAAARTCYRSEGKTTYDESGNSTSAAEFVKKIVGTYKHRSVAEHGTVYLFDKQSLHTRPAGYWWVSKYIHNEYSRVVHVVAEQNEYFYVTTNYRVIIENGWEDDLKYWCEPTEHHLRRYTVRFFTDRGVSAESNRHRANSPTERSTRFVNYGHDGTITVCVPDELDEQELYTVVHEWGGPHEVFKSMCKEIVSGDDDVFGPMDVWLFAQYSTEWSYLKLLDLGWKPQQARRVLPMDVETELVVTAYADQWARYFAMRYYGISGTPHPDMKVLAGCIMDQFYEQGWFEPLDLAKTITL